MFERLEVENFQCYDKLSIDFDPHITTFVGPSDVGKSALLRAIRWVCLNTPASKGLLKRGTDRVRARLGVDGRRITRSYSRHSNLYVVDGAKLRALSKSRTPEQVSGLLSVQPFNFSGQHDASFWLSSSPGQVSRELNAIINLEVIDRTLKNLASGLSKARATVGVSKDRLAEARKQRDELEYAVALDQKLQKAEKAQGKLENITKEKDGLMTLLEEQAERRQLAVEAGRRADLAKEASQNFHQASLIAEEVWEFNNLLQRLMGAKVVLEKPTPKLDPLFGASIMWQSFHGQSDKLRQLCLKITNHKELACRAEESLSKIEKELHKLMPDQCPLCGHTKSH